MSKLSGLDLAVACAKAADDIQAENIMVLDLRGISSLTDFMIICTGKSTPHLKAVIREISKSMLEEHDVSATYTDGGIGSSWVVLDFVDVMIHVFDEETRDIYGLEQLWSKAETVDWQSA